MAIQFPDFQRISFDEANPWLVGAERGQALAQKGIQFPLDMQAKILANQIAQVQAKYAEPLTKADLEKAQLFNKYYGQDIMSQIGLRGAQATNLGAETKKTNYLLEHPGLMGNDTTKALESLRTMGLVGNDYQPINNQRPAAQPEQQPNISTSGYTPLSNNLLPSNAATGSLSLDQNNAIAQSISKANDIANSLVRQQSAMNIPSSQTDPIKSISAPPDLSGNSATPGFNINGLVQALVNKPIADYNYKQTITKVMQQNLAGKAFTSMPAAEKEYAIAQARSLGYTGEQASRLFNQGYDLASLAQNKGYDGSDPSSWPAAKGAPTTAIQTRIQRANSTLAALQAVEPEITQSYAQYEPRFHNVAPGLIKDMLTGQNPDQQADALAAYALYPEIAALRINAMGGNVGEGAIQHIADAAFSRLNTLGLSPNSLVYQKVQKRVGQLITKMNKAENTAIYSQRNQMNEQEDRASGSSSDYAHMSDDDLMKIAQGG